LSDKLISGSKVSSRILVLDILPGGPSILDSSTLESKAPLGMSALSHGKAQFAKCLDVTRTLFLSLVSSLSKESSEKLESIHSSGMST